MNGRMWCKDDDHSVLHSTSEDGNKPERLLRITKKQNKNQQNRARKNVEWSRHVYLGVLTFDNKYFY